jgi:hypothetical protein
LDVMQDYLASLAGKASGRGTSESTRMPRLEIATFTVHGCHFQFYAAQHSVQPTSGTLRVFWQCSTPQQDSAFKRCLRPAHLRLTQTVGQLDASLL